MSQSEAAQQAELGVGDVEKHTTFAEVESQDEESGVVVATRNGEPVEPKEKKYIKDEDGKAEAESSEEKEEEIKFRPSTVFKLFRYAKAFDVLLLIVGTLAAIAHGAAIPLITFLLGQVTDAFFNRAATQLFATPNNTDAFSCATATVASFANVSDASAMAALLSNISTGTVVCNANALGVTLETIVLGCFGDDRECLPNDEFIDTINRLVYGFVGVAVAALILGFTQISFFQVACERQVKRIRLQYYRAVLRQNMGWFDTNPSGELSSRLSDDIEKIHDGIGDKLSLLIQWISTFFTGFIIGFITEYRLTLVLLGFTPFLAIAGGLMASVVSLFTSREQKQYAAAGAVAEEVLTSIRTVVAFGGEHKEAERYNEKLIKAQRLGAKKGLSVGLALGFVFFLIFIVYAVGLWFGGWLISTGRVTPGDAFTTFFAVLIAAFSLGQAAPNLENLLSGAGAAGTIFETIDRQPPIDSSSEEGLVPDKLDSTIDFNDVRFSYPTRPDVQVLDGLTLRVEPGQTVALVGPSGCGKSTTIQLLQRFYDVAGGEVLVGGNDIRKLNLKWLRRNVGVVSQEPVLFDTTIAENIRFGREDATMEDIERAAKNANAYDFISQLPNGFDTPVGERGTQLSGGQKQRIAIARALVKDPKILLLDEATSALDTESESIVQAALDHAREGRTTIVIAHRLSTIKNADIIASVEDGQIVEMGTHAQLIANKGLYFELVTAQSYATDEMFIAGDAQTVVSPRRVRSLRSESASGHPSLSLSHSHLSLRRQTSVLSIPGELRRQVSLKQLEEWDKEVPVVPLSRIVRLNANEWWIIVLGVIGAMTNGVIFPMFAIIFGEIVEVFNLPIDQVFDEIHLWGGLFLLLGFVSGTAQFAKQFCFSVSGENLTSRLRLMSFKAMLRQDIGWFDNERNSSGALTTRLSSDAGQVQGATGSRLGTIVEIFSGLVLVLVIGFVYSWLLTLVVLGILPLVIFAALLQVQALAGYASNSKKSLEDAGKVAVDSIENIRTVATLGIEETFFNKYRGLIRKPHRQAVLNSFVYGITYGFSQSTLFFMCAIVFRFGAFQVTRDSGDIAHEDFSNIFRVFIAFMFGALNIGQAGAFAPNYTKARVSANRIFSLLDLKPEIDSYSEEGDKLNQVIGEIDVSNAFFHYPTRPEVKVLQGLSVSVKPGKTLALVGPSGCGKSTIVSLLERFYNPRGGSLTLDGSELKDLNLRWLRAQIGIVSQEPVLFDTTAANNIRYGASFREVSDEEVIAAAKAANIHNFLEALPQGYNTNVGAKGAQLSGGQKQRIAIARALVRDPRILLLDEATSALDTESEKIVQEALDKAREGRTSIVIAHRLSTIYNADCIAVLKGGKVAELGTHSELLAKRGIYYKLNRFQLVTSGDEDVFEDPPIELQ